MSQIISLVYKPEDSPADSFDYYTRIPLTNATLVVGHGIQGDRKGTHPDRQLNIMSLEVLEALRAEGFKTEPGQMGEQIVISGIDVATLEAGTILELGPEARAEVVKLRTGCDKFENVQGKLRTQAAQRLGLIARVIVGGPIQVGDPVKVAQPELA